MQSALRLIGLDLLDVVSLLWGRSGRIRRHDDSHRRPRARGAVGAGGTAAAGPAPPALRWPAPCHPRSQLLRRDRVHGPHLDTVATPASPTARLRLARDLLAPPHRMGRRRRVRPAPPSGVGPPWP